MSRGVDAARQSGNNSEAGGAEIGRQPLGEQKRRARAFARADNGDGRLLQPFRIAAHGDQRRRRVELRQQRRIIGLAAGDEARAQRFDALQLGFSARLRPGAEVGDARQRFERRCGGAELRDQAMEVSGPIRGVRASRVQGKRSGRDSVRITLPVSG